MLRPLIFIINLFNFLSASIINPPKNPQIHKERSFKIDAENGIFLKDGKPFRYIAGEIHYFRIHPSLWRERLEQVRAAGLNAIQFYIPWNYHEEVEGKFNFAGDRDVLQFLSLTQQNGLNVLLRIGPYIGPEWEFGGLPWWLVKIKNEGGHRQNWLRTSDPKFLLRVEHYFDVLLPMLKPMLHRNGGPILMIQLESNYGNVPHSQCDPSYMEWLRNIVHSQLGPDVLLYTVDGVALGDEGICGSIEGVLPTVAFRPPQTPEEIKSHFATQKRPSNGKNVPRVNSEFLTMGPSIWGENGVLRQKIPPILEAMDEMWTQNASFSFYMFHGGTNFGFWSGRSRNSNKSEMVTTSYDFGAPISESGQLTPLYEAIHKWIGNLPNWPNPPLAIPSNKSGISIDNVVPIRLENFLEILNASSSNPYRRCKPTWPPFDFEHLERNHHFVFYSTRLDIGGTWISSLHVHGRAHVFLNKKYEGTLVGNDKNETGGGNAASNGFALFARMGSRMDLLVESKRGKYPLAIPSVDLKEHSKRGSIISAILLDGRPIMQRWLKCGVDMEAFFESAIGAHKMMEKLPTENNDILNGNGGPSIYVGKFTLPFGNDLSTTKPHTFFDSRGWGYGMAMVNGFNIGRYWPMRGPQTSIFIPGALLNGNGEENFIVLLELVGQQQKGNKINFIAEPIVDFFEK